jgi:SNF2 family DNA or RNA helicase
MLTADHCMAALPWGMVIVDESHNLRTTNARGCDAPHTEACVAAVRRAARAVLLTGTPSLARPYDLYRQVDALAPGLLGATKEVFSQR